MILRRMGAVTPPPVLAGPVLPPPAIQDPAPMPEVPVDATPAALPGEAIPVSTDTPRLPGTTEHALKVKYELIHNRQCRSP